jgi:tRNA-specific 2-thiouridylase
MSLKNYLPAKPARIAVAMSGGVDSSVVALMLHQQGYDIIGFTAWTLNGPGSCCNDALVNAGRICESLGVPYDTVDLRAEFAHYVMDHYAASYQAGLTPNPCVECNRHVKWEALVRYARKHLGADYIATGHYAQIVKSPEGRTQIHRAVDTRKDQTYMLARVRPDDLEHALFPLGHLTKPEVVKMAQEAHLPSAYSKESMDVCFVLEGQANYLKETLGSHPGPILDIDTGLEIGTHQGHYLFTRGQRKGVQVAAGRPVYVIKTEALTNTVWVGDAHHLSSYAFTVKAVNWLVPPEQIPTTVMLKIRYASEPMLASLEPMSQREETHCYRVNALTPEGFSGVTPGQIAVFYDSDFSELLGGGYIEAFLPHGVPNPERELPELTCSATT